MTTEFEPTGFRPAESEVAKPWDRHIVGITFKKALYRAALSKRIPSQAELARRVGVTPATVNYWITGKAIPRSKQYQVLLDTLRPNAKDRERLTAAYKEGLEKRRLNHLQAQAKRRNKSPTPVGRWMSMFSKREKISLAELQDRLFRKTSWRSKGPGRFDKPSLATLSAILTNAPRQLNLTESQTASLAEAVAETIQRKLAKGHRFQDGIRGQAVIELQKRIPFETFNGQQAGKILGRSRESVRQLRKKLGLPLLLNPDQLDLLRTFPKRKRGKDRAPRRITTRSSNAA